MAIRKVILSAAVALALFCSPASAEKCMTIDNFHHELLSNGIDTHASKAAATDKMEALINKNRAKIGRPNIDASVVLAAYVQDQAGNITIIAAVVDQGGCIVEETLTTLTVDVWLSFLSAAGVEVEDFVKIDGA